MLTVNICLVRRGAKKSKIPSPVNGYFFLQKLQIVSWRASGIRTVNDVEIPLLSNDRSAWNTQRVECAAVEYR